MGNEPNAKVSFSVDDSSVTAVAVTRNPNDDSTIFPDIWPNSKGSKGEHAVGQSGYVYVTVPNNVNGNAVTVTFDNLQNSSYLGHKISKIVTVFHDLVVDGGSNHRIAISNNPYYGIFVVGVTNTGVKRYYYDEKGNRITFNDGEDGGGAWLTAGSLNAGSGRTEEAQLTSSGKAYGFYGSTVTVHNNNLIYSDHVNEPGADLTPAGKTGFGDGTLAPGLNQENKWWDTDQGLNDPNAYMGAGVFHVTGDYTDVNFTVTSSYNQFNSWFTLSTLIPQDGFKITPPTNTVHYHFDVRTKLPLFKDDYPAFVSESKF
ncbi:GbpC/Spa domain-containing protein [uncultured Limosilactobacillus sp.]|uniref:GbpC/Spa domain-containing protein n=1 Tax=uncultured Limosilactobacillus sp. TaxID=2837629 RepID=UPI0025D2A243|nr:GbpC/Spa domain-containing protein [uncultured Limosilactobacillus sp.]